MDKYHLYVVLTRTNTVISRLIKLFTNDEYTHAAIALDRELNSMYSFGRKYSYNPFIGRFKRECVDKGIYRLQKEVPCIILEVDVSKQQYEKAQSLVSQFISNSHLYKYNYKGLLYNLFKVETYEDNRFLCSEFVYYVLKKSGIVDFNISRSLVRPQNLLALESNIIFKGNLRRFEHREKYYVTGKNCIRGLSVIYE